MERKSHNSLTEAALEVQRQTHDGDDLQEHKKTTSQKVGGKEDLAHIAAHNEKRRKAGTYPKPRPVEKTRAEIMRDQPTHDSKGNKITRLGDHVEYDEVDSMVLEYFESYFGDDLNEDTSNEEIMEAVTHLVLLTESVCEAVGLKMANLGTNVEKLKSPNKLQKDSVEHDGDDIQELKTSTLQNYLKKSIYKGRGADPNLGRRKRKSMMKATDRLATRKTRMYQGGERGSEIK